MVTTNAMRLLTQAGIPFTPLCYAYDESDLSGVPVSYTHLTLPTILRV